MKSPSKLTNIEGSIDDCETPSNDAMADLLADIGAAPSNEEEQDSKSDVALVLWSHLSECERREAWNKLYDTRKQAKTWATQV